MRELFTKSPSEVNRVHIRTSRRGRDLDLRNLHLVQTFPDGIDKVLMSTRIFETKMLRKSVDGVLPYGQKGEEHIGVIVPVDSKTTSSQWQEKLAKRLQNPSVGIGGIAADYLQIRERFYRAIIASHLGPRLADDEIIPTSNVYYYDKFASYHLLVYTDPELLKEQALILDDLLNSATIDKESTMKVFNKIVRDRKGIQETVKIKSFHRNTILYRLGVFNKVLAKKCGIEFGLQNHLVQETIEQYTRANLVLDIFAKAQVLCDIEHPAELRGYRRQR